MDKTATNTLHSIDEIFRQTANNFLTARSILALVISLAVALIIGRVLATMLRRVVAILGERIDNSENLSIVTRLRRYETLIVLSIALIRSVLVFCALYFWWVFVHPTGQPTAIIGASALALVLFSASFTPILRDISAGSVMMAEQWYGVGDHVRVEPFMDMQGVVERVTLRSTRIRGLNGEVMWVNNQHIQSIRISPRGTHTIGFELFVTDLEGGKTLIEETNKCLPVGPLLVVTPLVITATKQIDEKLWQLTAIGETAPGREWIIEHSATALIKTLDEKNKNQIIANGPLARFADTDAERRFMRTINNARKRPAPRRRARAKAKTTKT